VDEASMRDRVAAARVGRLATTTRQGRPHVVPCCFVLRGDQIFTAIDDVKAKRTLALRRVDNVESHPEVALLVDHYDEDWSALWWVRMDGSAALAAPGSAAHESAIDLLVEKYEQYRSRPPPGPVIVLSIEQWRAWP
jgi:PPOX class probable F420-dependent enzyme